ncbi:MAG: aldose epimerase family protein [Planctomycetota bacterium]
MNAEKTVFDTTPAGEQVDSYTIVSASGALLEVLSYGGIVRRLAVPDREGVPADVVLGCDSVEDYLQADSFFGALIGRFGNRIARGRFALDGQTCHVTPNEGENHLHGGATGFDKVLWDVEPRTTENGEGVRLHYISPDGEEGYPGTLHVTVTYVLTREDALRIDYEATTDKPTPVNLTHHSYFNLSGHDRGDVLSHELQIHADAYLPVDEQLLPTGEIADADGAMDFRQPKPIGRDIQAAGGYDHCYVLRGQAGTLRPVAWVRDPASGRVMEVSTTEPGMQLYTGNNLSGESGKGEASYGQHAGFCLEAQHYPDSPNHPEFPSTILPPGQRYRQATVYRFSAE